MDVFYAFTVDEWDSIAAGEVPVENGYYWIGRQPTGRKALVYISVVNGEWDVPADSPLKKEKVTHFFGPFPTAPDMPAPAE